MLLEPVGEALVQLGARRLRERVVGGVADQEVAEAERRPRPASCGRSGRTSSLRTSAASRGVTSRLLRRERLHGAAVEELALDRAALEHPALGLVELVEPRRQQRLERRRHLDLAAVRVGRARPSPSRRAGCRRRRGRSARAARPATASPTSASASSAGERLEPQRRPASAGRRSSSSGRAMQSEQERRAGREQRDVLDQVEERLLAPLDVVEARRRAAPASSSSLRNAQAISSAPAQRLALAEQRADRRRGRCVVGQRVRAASPPRPPASR